VFVCALQRKRKRESECVPEMQHPWLREKRRDRVRGSWKRKEGREKEANEQRGREGDKGRETKETG